MIEGPRPGPGVRHTAATGKFNVPMTFGGYHDQEHLLEVLAPYNQQRLPPQVLQRRLASSQHASDHAFHAFSQALGSWVAH